MLVISAADFEDPALREFLQAHLDELEPTAPPQSRHALDLTGLQAPGVRLWVAHDGETLVGTVALAALGSDEGELKSMRTDPSRRRQGVAAAMVGHVLAEARGRALRRLWLETGSQEFFAAARALYRRHGFVECAPFGSYRADPNSTFMTLALT